LEQSKNFLTPNILNQINAQAKWFREHVLEGIRGLLADVLFGGYVGVGASWERKRKPALMESQKTRHFGVEITRRKLP
jgi:hypothetical protein